MGTPRHFLTSFALFTLITSNAQQLTNGGFEDWTQQVAFTQLADWSTSNWGIPGAANVAQVSDAPSGQLAARLRTLILGDDTLFGFILLGEFINDVPTAGVPFNTEVDRITGRYRYDIMPEDSALLAVGIWSGGILVSFDTFTIGGQQLDWNSFEFPLNAGDPVIPDSVIVALASSNPFAPAFMQAGSHIDIDALELNSPAVPQGDQLPNYDMEDWFDVSTEEPDGWGTFNQPLVGAGITPVTKSNNAHGGNFSARLETFNLGMDTLPGVLGNSAISFTGGMTGQPFSEVPLTLDGWFRYEPSGTDTAVVYALFTQNGGPVGSAAYQITEETLNWTPFSAPVIMLIPPDTLTLVIFSGDHPGSVLYIDDLLLDGLLSDVQYVDRDQAFLFPNPASDQVTIHLPNDMRGAGHARVIDAQGRTVLEQPIAGMASNILYLPVNQLAAGRYVVELINYLRTERLMFVRQ